MVAYATQVAVVESKMSGYIFNVIPSALFILYEYRKGPNWRSVRILGVVAANQTIRVQKSNPSILG
jgi:hypothetical protein